MVPNQSIRASILAIDPLVDPGHCPISADPAEDLTDCWRIEPEKTTSSTESVTGTRSTFCLVVVWCYSLLKVRPTTVGWSFPAQRRVSPVSGCCPPHGPLYPSPPRPSATRRQHPDAGPLQQATTRSSDAPALTSTSTVGVRKRRLEKFTSPRANYYRRLAKRYPTG